MVKRGPHMRPQASEGEAQHGLFCWTRCVGQGNEHLSGASGLLVAPPGGSNPYLHSEQFCAQEVAKNKATSPRGRPTHQQRTKKMKGFGDGALSNFHFPKVPPQGVAPVGTRSRRMPPQAPLGLGEASAPRLYRLPFT